MWGIFKTDVITLQYISGYLSLGTIGAFVIGGLLYEILKEKRYHLGIIIFTIIIFGSIYFTKNILKDYLFIAIITILIGFFYGLWGVLRNILISTQIHETNLGDTKINGLANIFFITSIIIGSIVGGILAEKLSFNGIFIICILLGIGLFSGVLMNYKNLENKNTKETALKYKQNFLADFKFILKKYSLNMVFIALIITIATILSQKAIEYSVENLGKSGSQSAIILLYSAVGSIIGNIVSMKINENKWLYFLIFSILFAITIYLFPTFINNFAHTSILAFIAGIFFGITYNLLEADFFKCIAIDDKKSYGSASLGIITSLIISILMFLVDVIQRLTSFAGVYYFMGSIILLIGIVIFSFKKS
ncbi:MAG: MFS transporter [Candidatus Gracilibacteria bacterium]|nr:MFS transporter [Candidatus Gracilibacteria bacterium]